MGVAPAADMAHGRRFALLAVTSAARVRAAGRGRSRGGAASSASPPPRAIQTASIAQVCPRPICRLPAVRDGAGCTAVRCFAGRASAGLAWHRRRRAAATLRSCGAQGASCPRLPARVHSWRRWLQSRVCVAGRAGAPCAPRRVTQHIASRTATALRGVGCATVTGKAVTGASDRVQSSAAALPLPGASCCH